MMEICIYTREIAEELIKRGFKCHRTSKYAWHFEYSLELQEIVTELTVNL